jgi:endonuclease/exonuclease/phosphatase family metal-dependent hydrolase
MISFNILTYNIMTPVPAPLRCYGQTERGQRIKDVIKSINGGDFDAVLFNEMIAPGVQKTLFKDMKELGFKYHTSKLTKILAVSGGILIFSKHEITQEDSTNFGDKCVGMDCFAAKGLVYARIKKDGQFFNVFGTHLQAWPDIESQMIRESQIEQMRKFMSILNIPQSEPVLLCGDLNMDMYLNNDTLKHLRYKLKMDIPELHTDSHPFTVDPTRNSMVGNDNPDEYKNDEWPDGCVAEYYKTLECPCCPSEWIDYTLYSSVHLLPTNSWMKAVVAKVAPFSMLINAMQRVEIEDVSDHFPVWGHFEFPTSTTTTNKKANNELDYDEMENLESNSWSIALVVVIVFLSVFLFVIVVYTLYINQSWKKIRMPRNAF